MKVTLINFTAFAVETLIFTKGTRLDMNPSRFFDIKKMSEDQKLAELKYMANTIPSSWEFVDYIFMIEGVSRAFTHQWVRTRPNSNAQQSMRVTHMGEFEYVTGPSLKRESKKQYDIGMSIIKEVYRNVIYAGGKVEDARGILPTNICTNICAKVNLRTLSELSRSRTGGRTQSEYRNVVDEIVNEVLAVHPWAELFLFPKERGFFDELEEFVAADVAEEKKPSILKIIDKMRKKL